jgi:hypothetical protein
MLLQFAHQYQPGSSINKLFDYGTGLVYVRCANYFFAPAFKTVLSPCVSAAVIQKVKLGLTKTSSAHCTPIVSALAFRPTSKHSC